MKCKRKSADEEDVQKKHEFYGDINKWNEKRTNRRRLSEEYHKSFNR
jgi:hypothetical protein